MTKVHLGVTFLWLLDFVRIVMLAQWSLMSRLPDLLMDNYTFELYVLLGASAAMFLVNVRAKARAAAAK
jgi:Na+-translocating ferredoxin:NAD+ oxidoreductase RnfE subunit